MQTRSFFVRGRVQGVMFRQTFIRGALKRKLQAGATNDPHEKTLVEFTLKGEKADIDRYWSDILNTRPLNSWGAMVEGGGEMSRTIPIEEHEVTTENVDAFNWSSGVEFYI